MSFCMRAENVAAIPEMQCNVTLLCHLGMKLFSLEEENMRRRKIEAEHATKQIPKTFQYLKSNTLGKVDHEGVGPGIFMKSLYSQS